VTGQLAARRANPAQKKTRPTRTRVVYGFNVTSSRAFRQEGRRRGYVPEQGPDVNVPAAGDWCQRLCGLAGVSEAGGDGLLHQLADVRRIALTMIENPGGDVGWFLHWQIVGHTPPLRVGVTAQMEADTWIPGLGAAKHDELMEAFGYIADAIDGRRAGARHDRIRFGEPFACIPARLEPQPCGVDFVVRADAGLGDPVETVTGPLEPAAADGAPQVVIVGPGRDGLGTRDESTLASGDVREGADETTLPHKSIILRNWSDKPFLQCVSDETAAKPDHLSRCVA